MTETTLDQVHWDAAIDDTNLDTVYRFSDIGGDISSLPSKYYIQDEEAFSQYSHEDSHASCGLYGNRQGINDQTSDNQDPYNYNHEAITGWGLSPQTGWSMNLALPFGKAKTWYPGWVRCADINEVKQAISKNLTIFTGTYQIDFAKTRDTSDKIAVRTKKGPGHFFEVNGYDDDKQLLRVKDSMGPKAWDGTGHFYIRYQDFDILYSCMVRPTQTGVQAAQAAKDAETIQQAIKLGFTNGERLQDNLLRYEAVLLIMRAKEGVGNDDVQLQRAKDVYGIWDGSRGSDVVTRGELMLMISAYLGIRVHGDDDATFLALIKTGITLAKNRELHSTREQGILLITRAYNSLQK